MSSNTLNNKYLAKNATNTNKKTIDINKTTTATTEEKEAAAADALSSPQTTPAPIEPWHTLIDKLTEESAWLDVACMHSGYGSLLKTHIKEAVEVFRQHVILHDNGNVLLNMKDTRQYFVNFVRAGQRTSQELHMLLQGLEKQQSAAAPPDPYRYELLVDGRRTYLGCPIPDGAPPRPDNTAFWNETARSWTSQTPPPSSKKAETETRLKRHTPASGMPHVSVPNATCQRSECHTSARPKCGIYPREVWHFNPLSVAFQPLRLP